MAESISELATALRSGELTAEALLDRCLERIRRIDPSLNSFVAVDEDGARTAAKASDARFADRLSAIRARRRTAFGEG